MKREPEHSERKSNPLRVNRRTFVQTLIAGASVAPVTSHLLGRDGDARAGVTGKTPGPEVEAEWLKLTGYADRFSVSPGETIRFMVSSEQPQYRADLVRLIHGDVNPRGPGFKEEPIESPISGEYPGGLQPLRAGSFVSVPDAPALRLQGSFTLVAWIAASTPGKGVQGLVTKWVADEGRGYALVLEADGSLGLRLGNADGHGAAISTGVPLRPFLPVDVYNQQNYPVGQMTTTQSWYFVAASFDAASRKVTLHQEPLTTWPVDETRATASSRVEVAGAAATTVPLLMAAMWERYAEAGNTTRGHFNGKIAHPALFDRALSAAEIEVLRKNGPGPRAGAVAAWDFSREMDTRRVVDVGGRGFHGQTVNMPARAMTGPNWTARELRFSLVPHEYGAIYFHDDDLDDARWEPGFAFTVPATLKSGIYAARIRAGDREDHIPFFVRPPKGTASAPIAVLLPTFTYLAYGNLRSGVTELVSLYSRHSDGSGVMYASILRPIVQLRPKFNERSEHYVRHLGADLYLIDWLEKKGWNYDIITDHDFDAEGESLLRPYRVVITGSHPEYTSMRMLEGTEAYLKRGGRLMYLGGNGYYWVASRSPADGTVLELRRNHGTELWAAAPGEYYHSTTGEMGGLWRFRGHPPQRYLGVGFAALGGGPGRPYRRRPGSFDPRASFIFEGIGRDELIGDFPSLVRQHAAASDEIDRFDPGLGSPPHALVLATADGFDDSFQPATEEVLLSDPSLGGTRNPNVRADMVFFECPNGGAVFSVGTMSWFAALSYNNYDNTVSRVTENVLRRFAAEEPWPSSAAMGGPTFQA